MARILKSSNIVIALLGILLVTGIVLALGYALLPTYLEKRLLPKLAADAGLSEVGLKVRRVGFFGADLAKIRLGPASNPGLVLDALQIDYTPGGLLNKKIDRIVVNGVLLHFLYRNGRLQLTDSLASLLRSGPSRQVETAGAGAGLLPFENLAVRHARVRFSVNERIHTFPLDLDLIPDHGAASRMTVEAVLWPGDQRVEVQAKIDLEAGTADVQTNASALKLNALADFLDPVPGLRLEGGVDIESRVRLAFSPFKIVVAEATLNWSGNGIQYNNLRISPAAGGPDRKSQWQLKAVATEGGDWQVKADPILAESPVPVQLTGLKASIRPGSAGYHIEGQISALPLPVKGLQTTMGSVELVRCPRIDGSYQASINQQTGWSFSFEGVPSRPRLEIEIGASRLDASMSAFQASGSGDADQMVTEYAAALKRLRIHSGSLKASATALSVAGKTDQTADSPDTQRSEIRVSLGDVTGDDGNVSVSGARVGFFGTIFTTRGKAPRVSGMARFSTAELKAANASLRIAEITGRMPVVWPPPEKRMKTGNFAIAKARFQSYQLTDLAGVIRQTRKGFDLEGRHPDAIVPGLELKFDARSQLVGHGAPVIELNASARRSQKAPAIDLGMLMPGGQGVQLSGRLEAKTDLRVDVGGTSGRSTLLLADATVQAARGDFKINGLRLGLEIPGLPVLRSAPGQQISFTSAQLGDIRIENGRLDFQIEPAPAILLEKGQFDWSEGQVDMHSSRIYLDREDYDLTLFCDRLNLAVLLEQFGAVDAEGSGTVSGKIPIRYRNQKWSVANGFLFSSPGEGGQIRVQGTEILTAGIPKDAPQYMQLEIAREALKDYNFEWAKLTISTEGEDMLLKLQLDGKPARTLPFAFRKDIGSFARVDGQAGGSKFQGIRLDVNFRLPLNKILQYKSIIQMMRKKGAN
jgi:hypothetical protein